MSVKAIILGVPHAAVIVFKPLLAEYSLILLMSYQKEAEKGGAYVLSSKLDSPVIKTLERHFFTLSECLSNNLITGESDLDERNGQLILKEITS